MNENGDVEPRLEMFFAAGRAETPVPRMEFLSAILSDAAACSKPAPVVVAPRPSWLRQAWEGFGGWRGGLALATCAALGFWIGAGDVTTVRDGQSFLSASGDVVPDPVVAFFDSVEG